MNQSWDQKAAVLESDAVRRQQYKLEEVEIEGDDDNNDDDEDDEDDNENLPPTHGHRQMCNISIHQYLLVNDADEVCSRTLDLDVFL